jgi:N-methylhydantoinase A/oxoprolinase/acetone carboxylase beta subunit
VDGVLLEGSDIVSTAKVPREGAEEDAIRDVLTALQGDRADVEVDRVVVATTLVVNATVQDRLARCTSLLIPGPGLDPDRSLYGDENVVVPGCIDHRGRVTEDVEYEGAPETAVAAITGKFSPRNPDLEREVAETIDFAPSTLALGNEAGADFTFPERAATAVANAKTKPVFTTYQDTVASAIEEAGIDAQIYYLKGDGSMLAERTMRSTPANTLRSGVAASTIGLLALTDVDNAICVDIGGTTTDIARVTGGFPDVDAAAVQGDIEPAYDGVTSESLSMGGDVRVEAGPRGPRLTNRREGNASAFGGDVPTLTDALCVAGIFQGGDGEAAREALASISSDDPVETVARAVIDKYVNRVGSVIDRLTVPGVTRLVVGGMLAPYLAEPITGATRWMDGWQVPEYADVAGAIGCAVARVSVETSVHIDSPRGVLTVTATGSEDVVEIEEGRTFTDEEVEEIGVDHARATARAAGASGDEPCEVLTSERFNVVRRGRVVGEIVDLRARTKPGIEHIVGTDT